MFKRYRGLAALLLIGLLVAGAGLLLRQQRLATSEAATTHFLTTQGIRVTGAPERFTVTIPKDWGVKLGDYPEGLYWGIINALNTDAGLDLAPLKGKRVQVWRYALAEGLPGEGDSAQFRYPSDAVLLVRDAKVVGAWLAFNRTGIGPSIRQRSLEQVTGLTKEAWLQREGYFTDPGPNADLATMHPGEVVAAWLDAINRGEKRRAYAAMAPQALEQMLTLNLPAGRLYHKGFQRDSSLVESIRKGQLLSYGMLDPETLSRVTELGERSRIELEATLLLAGPAYAPDPTEPRRHTRFIIMTKGQNGWQIEGMGTGP